MNAKPSIDAYFSRLDSWRHLPSYRLENRVDAFFSFYLHEALEPLVGKELLGHIVPEMPLRKGTLDKGSDDNGSKKVDFVLFSKDLKTAYFVELKTDIASRGEDQDRYLKTCAGLYFYSILEGLLTIIPRSKKKQKYMHLVRELERIGLLEVPPKVYDCAFPRIHPQFNRLLQTIKINALAETMKVEVVYVQPEQDPSCTTLSFDMLEPIVSNYKDPISKALSAYLSDWRNKAGCRHPAPPQHSAA